MDDLKHLFKENYLAYASYVILDRAIPNLTDGLKPVQRRILYTLRLIDDGKLHKVANVAGQTMALHPHGDAPIVDALVNLANKGFLLDRQGNFGNPFTGDPHAAPRYIETRLSPLAREALFNKELTQFLPSYDGRTNEPVSLPVKIPLLLLQGAEGIAVGMSTHILSHNFKELIEAEIAHLEGLSFKLLPDFPSGGTMDASDYDKGRGKIKLRAKIDIVDDKTLVIREICHKTTTESVIRSIDEAAKKGKIKIEQINDYTADKIEIEIKLPRGQHSKELVDALYAFTDCETTLHSNIVAIKDKMPWEGTVNEMLIYHTELLQGYLKKELEIKRDQLVQLVFEKTLEQIFIENRLYKKIEEMKTFEAVKSAISKSLIPFHHKLSRPPNDADRDKLLSIPLRKISRFDMEKSQKEIRDHLDELGLVEKNLKNIKAFTIKYLQTILQAYGPLYPRRTKIKKIEELDIKKIAKKNLRLGYDPETGYLGTKVGDHITIECTNFDKLLVVYEDGNYKVINIPEKEFMHTKKAKAVFIGPADKTTLFSALYRDPKTNAPYAKRFIVKQFILNKWYRFIPEGHKLSFVSGEKEVKVELSLKGKKRGSKLVVDFADIATKGASARGARVANSELKKVKFIVNGEEK